MICSEAFMLTHKAHPPVKPMVLLYFVRSYLIHACVFDRVETALLSALTIIAVLQGVK
jgi:hypothetical protein